MTWLTKRMTAAVSSSSSSTAAASSPPTRIDWLLHGDPAQHYLGFAFFRHEPWAWPLGAIAGFGAPLGTSLVYTDAIALLAIPFKLLSDWLPTDFQYLGGWMLLCYLLQGVYAERVLARLGVTGLAGALATVLLLTSPALALRAYGHESLMAHWLLLAAFEAHLAGQPRRLAPLWALGALIHAYWIALLAPFVLAGWLRRELGWAHRIGWLVTIVSLMTAVGYFVTRPEQLAGVVRAMTLRPGAPARAAPGCGAAAQATHGVLGVHDVCAQQKDQT